MKFFKTFLILATVSLFIFACANNQSGNGSNANTANFTANSPKNDLSDASPAPTLLDEVASGGKIYKEECARCHKEDGTGGEVVIEGKKLKPDNLASAHAKKESDEELIEHIVEGIPDEGMPAFKDTLSEAQIKEVVKYVRAELQK